MGGGGCAWPYSYDHRPSHPYYAGTEHVGFSPTRRSRGRGVEVVSIGGGVCRGGGCRGGGCRGGGCRGGGGGGGGGGAAMVERG